MCLSYSREIWSAKRKLYSVSLPKTQNSAEGGFPGSLHDRRRQLRGWKELRKSVFLSFQFFSKISRKYPQKKNNNFTSNQSFFVSNRWDTVRDWRLLIIVRITGIRKKIYSKKYRALNKYYYRDFWLYLISKWKMSLKYEKAMTRHKKKLTMLCKK